jgi:CO/xanthine dehydrogenase FAD-binding subunit
VKPLNKYEFYAPDTLESLAEALKLKRERRDVYIVAGGTDFSIYRKKQGLMDFSAIDLTQINALKEIVLTEEGVEVGAGVTMSTAEKSSVLKRHARALTEAAGRMGSTQIRNRATIGGNMANAAQCADTVTASCVLDATVMLMNADGCLRELPLKDFILGIGITALQPDEVLVRIRYPLSDKNVLSGFSKVGSRKGMSISKINLAIRVEFQEHLVSNAAFCFGSIGSKSILSSAMAEQCAGKPWDEELLSTLLELGTAQVDEAIPGRDSRHYKRIAVKGLISDVFQSISEQRMGL